MQRIPQQRSYNRRRVRPSSDAPTSTDSHSLVPAYEINKNDSSNGVSQLDNAHSVDKGEHLGNGPVLGSSSGRKRKRPSNKRNKQQDTCAALNPNLVPVAPGLLEPSSICAKCGATKFQFEAPFFCCRGGGVKLASNTYPEELVRLFDACDEDALHFRTYARLYNNLFAFSSLGGQIECSKKKGIYVFSLHGQLYHYIPPLSPEDGKPKYLQLYFYDAAHERENRASCFDVLRPDVISIIMHVMEKNPYASFFKSLKEKVIDEQTTIYINKSGSLDQRTYNAPTSDEVAVIWPDSQCEFDYSSPYIIVTGKEKETHRIMHYYGCYDPLQYPLLFPYGESGWHQGIRRPSGQGSYCTGIRALVHASVDAADLIEQEQIVSELSGKNVEKYVSCREYYAYQFQIRPGNHLLKTGRLLLQFLVDMYVKLENTRLDFLRNNQSTIRADLYQGLVDTLDSGESDGANIGRRIILPPSFIGGPRDMRRRYLNAMRLVQKYGKPDLFITMTCNPNWAEIKEQLKEGEQPQDRPDLLARIFRAKLIKLKKMLMQEQVMGEVAAFVYVVEFQKRGLPHAHILVILKCHNKIKGVDDFDKYISAEIPPVNQPHLRKLVIRHMMHGPCGIQHQDCPCMKEKEGRKACKYGYPKEFTNHTSNNDSGYPLYRRRNTGESIRARGEDLDNQWVIPYNPYLLAFFDCHLNVEVCSTIQAVKYLYKYVYKGHDKISFSIARSNEDGPIDEIYQFQSGRWVSAPEAAWRIFGFDLYEMHPSVFQLQVHLPNMQSVHFFPHEQLPSIVADQRRCRTPLTEFFRLNAMRGDGHRYLYSEFPEHFTWDPKARRWKDRKKCPMVGRLAFVGPSEGERFYLRVLLGDVYSPKSFADLLTVGNLTFSTFQEAAIQRGLVEDGCAIEQCLDEAVETHMPQALRRLLATTFIFSQPANPCQLWEKYYPSLSEDYTYQYQGSDARIKHLTVSDFARYLECMGRKLSDYGLGHLEETDLGDARMIRDIQDAIDAPIPDEYISARKLLNQEQKMAYKTIVQHVKQHKPGVFFIDGPGGTGKTFLYCALYAKVRQMNKIVLPTASSGIAAANLPTGRTAHSRFKLPLDVSASLTCDVPKQGNLALLLKKAELIIWDEASMANKLSVQSLDLLLRDLCSGELPFGGKIIVFGGDFRQVLPVVPHQGQSEAVNASLVCSALWPSFIKFHLTQNMRAIDDAPYADFLLSLGDGKLQQNEWEAVQLPREIVNEFDDEDDAINELSKFIFPSLHADSSLLKTFTSRAILTPKNDDVDRLNEIFINRFSGDTVTYKSFDTVVDDQCNIYPMEFLHSLCPGGMSPHELTLKLDCPVILLRNMDPSSGLCNGTRLTCKRFYKNIIECEVAVGFHSGVHVFLPRIRLQPSASLNYPFKFERKQFPIKLCFAMTINKAQGQTLDAVGVYLRQPCFSHGQLYVALSRARMSTKVKVVCGADLEHRLPGHVLNVVSFDVLQYAGII